MIPTSARTASLWQILLALGVGCPPALASSLPPAVAGLVEQSLPDYHLSASAASVAFGDFDGDGRDDVALLLEGAADWQLVVFRHQQDERYSTDLIEQFPGRDADFKQHYPARDLALDVVAPGPEQVLDGMVIDPAASDAAGLVLRLPPSEEAALLYRWDPAHQLFGTARLHLTAARAASACAYDPQADRPNPLGMRAAITLEERDGNTSVVYEQFPENLPGEVPATLATRRELVFYETPIERARSLMRDDPSYYREMTGDDDPAGFAAVDDTFLCQ
ncbi:MAG: hypothetical protein R3F54_12090 [Alphaproteobacteria bacterium]